MREYAAFVFLGLVTSLSVVFSSSNHLFPINFMTPFPLELERIPLCKCTIFLRCVHQLMDTEVYPISQLWGTEQQWILICKQIYMYSVEFIRYVSRGLGGSYGISPFGFLTNLCTGVYSNCLHTHWVNKVSPSHIYANTCHLFAW